MVTRKTLVIDRFATLVLALLLILGGAAAVWWWSGSSLGGHDLPRSSDTSGPLSTLHESWAPWVAALVGLLLALVGLRWISAHLSSTRVARLNLAGSDPSGRLDVAGPKVAQAAATAYADTLGVRSAKGTVVRDRGQLVARLSATIEPEADLALLARRADEVSGQLATVLGREDLRCSVELRVAARGGALSRTT